MSIYINEEDKKLFEKNGFDKQSVGDTINHYRSQGLSDEAIQGKINQRLNGWRTPQPQTVSTPATFANQNINPDEFKRNVDKLYDIPQVPMPPRNNAGYTNSDGVTVQTPPNLWQQGINAAKQIPQVVDAVNTFKNNIQQPVVNAGRAVARPILPKAVENKFIGSQADEALLNKFNGVQFPSWQELSEQYKSGKMPKDVYLQTLKDKLAVENARLDKNYRDWRNTEWGKELLLLGLSIPAAAATAGGSAVAAPVGVATQIPRAAQLANLAKAASLTGLKEGAKFGAKYGLGASLIDKNANPITEPIKDAISFGAINAVINPALQGTVGLVAGANKALNITGKMGEAVQKAAEAIKKAPEEFQNRTNPNNWTKETVYEKNPFNNTYEPKERWQYKPKETAEPRPEVKQISGEQTRAIANIAPKTAAKVAQEGYKPKTIPSGAPIEQSARAFSAIPDNIINNSKQNEYKAPRLKVMGGKTYRVLDDGSYEELPNKYAKIAPKTVEQIEQVKNGENLQANEIVGQEGNTNNEIDNIAKEYSQMLGQDEVRDFHRDFAAALVNKNAEKIKNLVAQGRGMNENSKKMFTKYTGIKLPSTIQGKKDVIDKWANGEITSETPTEEVTNGLIPSLKYKVSVSKDGLTADGLYMEGSDFHTDGNAAYLKEFVNADISKVERTTKANEKVEEQLKQMFNNTSQYTNKLEDIGKGIKRNKETWRVFKAGEYDNGNPKYVVVNDKYLLDKKDLELYSDNENMYAPMSIRKNGKQIGLVMPIVQRNGFNTSDMVDIKPMKVTAKKEAAKGVKKEVNSTNEAIEKVNQENGVKDPFEVAAEDIGTKNYKSYDDFVKEFSENAEETPQDYAINNTKEAMIDLGVTEEKPRIIKTPIEELELRADRLQHIIEGGGDGHKPDKTRYKSVNKMFAALERPDVIVESNGKKEYFKIFKDIDKTKNQIVSVHNDENGDFVYTTMPSDKGKNYFVNKINNGEIIYKKGRPELKNNSAVNNIITSNEENLNPKETAQVEPKTDQVKPKESTSKGTSKKKESKKLDDAGEFLQGNRKQDTSLTWDELKDMNDLIRAKNTTKAKVYPKPTLDELEKEGFSEFQAGVILNVYNKINAKPAAGYDKVEHQKLYVDTINEVMSSIKDYIKSHPDEFSTDLIAEAARKYRSWSYDYNQSLFDVIFPDTKGLKNSSYFNVFRHYPEYNRKAIIVGGNKFTGALQLNRSTLNDVMKAVEDAKKVKEKGEKVKKEPWEKNFVILEPDRWNKEYSVANKNSKQVYAKYETREEALAAVKRVQEKIDAFKDKKENFERDYVERRENNRDVTTEELRDAFGFRGVNFGNWTNEKERQNFANFAYDSLYDLAELLNLPPKALSLNGQLGLAYGAQGTGGKRPAAAHYIPEYKDINLTKEYGAGSLAHEWWHAVDNYFGNQATNKEYSREWALSLAKGGELRPELFEALENLQTQIKKAPFTEEDIKKNAERLTARYNRNIEYYAENIRNSYKRAKNADELLKIVDDLVENKEKYKSYPIEKLHEIENKFFKLLPENRDTLTNRGEFNWLLSSISRLNDIDELARKGANKTQFLQNAEKIDRQSGSKYWAEDTELGARAFAAYIFDKMENQNILNKFLSRSGDGAMINLDAFKELAEGEERESLTLSTTPKGEERARIFKAFDKLFDTIKTRPTEKGVELYSAELPEFMNKAKEVNTGYKDLDLTPIYERISKGIKGEELAKMLPKEIGDIINADAKTYTFGEMIIKNARSKGAFDTAKAIIKLNLEAIGNNPYKFIESLMHEIKHVNQVKMYLQIMAKPRKIWTPEERTYVAHYNICNRVNKERERYYNRHSDLIDKFSKNNFYSEKERINAISKLEPNEQKIIDTYDKIYEDYFNSLFEVEARAEGVKYAKGYRKESGHTLSRPSKTEQVGSGNSGKRDLGTNSWGSFAEVEPMGYKRGKEINDVIRDKVYDWHGKLESDRYDVDKALNSFIQLTKHKAKNLSQKTGVKISDKQLREILPFLRERTGFPKTLDRDDLRNIFNKLSGEDKAELAKFADSVSDKFEKYYTNYKDAKGEQTEESIENHISHIWDLDDKKKSLLTNYITTNAKFAKKRTIGTFVEGIDGIEINGEKVQFKPKTLDYAEILKSSSDNLIKATHDSILANEIKNLKYKGERMVMPAAKAPSEWIEVSHPALNKAVYMGSVGENEIPMIVKTPVKVHPEIADYVKAIFEVQKPNKFLTRFDALNGTVKQVLLGLSGFHGYALSESSVGNVGLNKTLKELNPFKIYDQIKNGNYDIYKNEEAAKRAINAGVQLGTPSDLQRNLTEEFLLNGFHIEKFGINKITEPVGKLAKPFGIVAHSLTRINNKILWDVLHNNFKILAFNTAIENLGENVTKEQERAVAQWVNDSFGGQAWELLGIKKSSVKAASRVLLSPDWNFSTIRQANAMFNSNRLDKLSNSNSKVNRVGKLLGINEEFGSKGARGKLGRGFWLLRSAIYFGLMYNALNAAFREKDRKEHPDLYPDEMTPMDYTIWANAYPMDNFYEKALPNIFIGRNKDGSARYLRLGKQFREVPEFLFNFMGKLGGKTAPLLSMAFRTYFGMGIGDAWNKLNGGEAYLDQNIWEGYGENAEKKEGLELAKGRAVVALKSVAPFMMSKYLSDNKHEFSMWDLVAQTHAGGAKSTVFKQTKEALKAGKPEVIEEIMRRAYQDGVSYGDIEAMVKYAKSDYKAENTKRYKKKLTKSFENADEKEYDRIVKKMTKKHLTEEEQRRIRNEAWEDYQKNNKS